MAFNGWFPHFSPSGEHLFSGTVDLWLDKTQSVGFGYQACWGANSGWAGEHRVIYISTPTPASDSGYGLWTVSVGGTPQNLGILGSYNDISCASNGRWAAWYPSFIKTSWGQSLGPQAGRPSINTTRMAYTLDYNADMQRLMLDGVQIDRAPIINVMLSEQALCWSRFSGSLGRDVWGMRVDVADTPSSVAASSVVEFAAIPIDTPSGPWILSYENTRLILRPWGSTTGYVVATGEAMYPTGVWRASTGTFRIAWSSSTGVYAEASINPASTRVALGGTLPSGPPGETTPGNPGSATTPTTNVPPLRQPMTDAKTGLVTEPWARWFEKQSQPSTTNIYGIISDSHLLGRGSSGSGPASTIDVGVGLVMRDTTLSVTLTDLAASLVQYGTRTAQPAATAVAIGTLYGVTDESVVERSNGTTWDPFGTW